MQWNWKIALPVMATSLVALTGFAYADVDNAQMRNLDNRVTALEQRKGAGGMINPSARPQIHDGADLFITGDLLYWKAQENGLPLSIERTTLAPGTVDGFPATGFSEKVVNLDHRWDFGCRVGIGYNMPHDGWDLSLTWLRFYTRASRHHHFTTAKTTLPSQSDINLVLGTNTANDTRASWKMHLNQLDLPLGRSFFVSKWLSVRPHVGLRSAWIWQKLKTDYRTATTANADLRNKDHISNKLNFWGLGICAGLDTQWGLGSGFSIYGDGAVSLLSGFFKNNRAETALVGSAVQYLGMTNSDRTSRAITDLELGLRWSRMFCNNGFNLQIQGGWEHHMYFGMNQFPTRMLAATDQGKFWQNQGDLTMQGWTLSMRFDF